MSTRHKPTEATEATAPPARIDRKARASARTDTRMALIRCGTQMCTERGFQVTSIDELLRLVGVPKGSFYHFFRNKHEFGEAVIENYAAYFQRKLDRLLSDSSRSPLQRMGDFVDEAVRGMERFGFQRGCLVGNLGQELGGLNDSFRHQLEAVLLAWQHRTADCFREAIACNELSPDQDSEALAQFFWIGWEGAILRAKLTRDAGPMRLFANMFFMTLARKHDV
ncbi:MULTISPECIES: acrylate utilization transcriptional regulator AcuR [unclassified Caballeronia]|uniref:acrylate utilization transcriptional regulator AcuR n=1 Tax=unclassified Caballeronia TaxID=2646786 RepID=UPI003ECEC021